MDSVIVHYQEIALKGRNRPWFIARLVRNLRTATADLDVERVRALMGRIELVLGPTAAWEDVCQRIGKIFGIANFARARGTGRDIEEVARAILAEFEEEEANAQPIQRQVTSFRVRASRADKSYPLTSPEIERQLGGRIKVARGWKVNLTNPELDVHVEVLPDRVFFSFVKQQGLGGLPTGTGGQVMCLLSGGIDSPVAASRIMKRGCCVRFVHFHAYPILPHASQEKVREIVELLTQHQLTSRLYVVAFGELQRQIVLTAPPALRVVLYRRLMMRIAERLARKSGAKALVTGESIGQVASQTLENLVVIDAATLLPILRPLVGLDKEEISTEARALGTYPISIIPDHDCCTLFTPKNPATKARLADVERAESNLPIEEMIEGAVAAAEREDFSFPAKQQAVLEAAR